ncbi:hypothetical protein C5B42_00875 [Candidatus Cerribacteria bacterium 'Amazon FNV 2010 28 9']|uniref:Uncharacterized protein n=1 Tax=Candidatus Cerribacteria bacterium 'Amazon FNV 2010 28 9' TaxID=2081795 RepID=A0A317JRC4_9BACT|nr:MAG: hypothetical protein C5B42_00875 [Candidatus Cerribacteria bacterium 'Amazon FNV 2010 28 9']
MPDKEQSTQPEDPKSFLESLGCKVTESTPYPPIDLSTVNLEPTRKADLQKYIDWLVAYVNLPIIETPQHIDHATRREWRTEMYTLHGDRFLIPYQQNKLRINSLSSVTYASAMIEQSFSDILTPQAKQELSAIKQKGASPREQMTAELVDVAFVHHMDSLIRSFLDQVAIGAAFQVHKRQ